MNIEKKIPENNIKQIIQKLNPLINIEETKIDVIKKNWLISGWITKITPIAINDRILIPYLYWFDWPVLDSKKKASAKQKKGFMNSIGIIVK